MRRLLIAALAVGAVFLAWRWETRGPARRASDPPQTLIVEPGATAGTVAVQLYGLGLVRHPAVFRVLVAVRGAAGRLKAGHYALSGQLSLDDILELLEHGEVVRRELTFPEGMNLVQMAQIAGRHGLDTAAFLAAARDPEPVRALDPDASDLEGYLFPDTYELDPGADVAGALVLRMARRFETVMRPHLPAVAQSGLDLREVVTLASLVELETARADERPRVAAVFLNRLRRGMLLQTDPTVIYAMRQADRYDGNIRKRDLKIDSPYNTYLHAGLPPGPIASPGLSALLAVLGPADTDELYFVSRNDGSHVFSRTLSDHNRAVDRYQRRREPQG